MKMISRLAATVAAATALLAVASATPATAAPSTPPSPIGLAGAKLAAEARIDGRLHTLSALMLAINAAKDLTSGHRSTLSALVTTDTSGLTALRTKVDGETTVAAVHADEVSMVVDYRIYMLVVPKVRYTIAVDVETAVAARLQDAHDKLAAIAAADQAAGKDVSAELAELADMASKITDAKNAIASQPAALLAVNPGADPAPIQAAVASARSSVRTARQDLATAAAEGKTVRNQLKALG